MCTTCFKCCAFHCIFKCYSRHNFPCILDKNLYLPEMWCRPNQQGSTEVWRSISSLFHRCNNHRDWGTPVPPPTFRLGDQQCIGPPNFLAVVFKKQEISQQVVTRMQDLASEFSKNFPGVIPLNPHSRRGRPPPAPNTQPGL